ncbi:RNA polymerase sigma factor [Ascidiimonas sp. W6]|uniref:RNA polymerase sigma factor n=1 Tax=Ascidiimonas meishanensis TaxID=3128903 RepID=UPI0030EC5916
MENKNICELFLDNYDLLKQYAFKICRDEDMAQDITQDVFVSIHSRYQNDDDKINNKLGFLYQAIKFSTYNQLKKNKIKHHSLDCEVPTNPLRNDFLLEDRIMKSIDKMPERQKRVFYLKRIMNYKVKEIAEIMQIKPKTVENHLTIVIKSLKKEYEPYLNDTTA